MTKYILLPMLAAALLLAGSAAAQETPLYVFNRAPLADKPYSELPLGAIEAKGWLHDQLERMAAGMTGHLDEWYPEVCGPRNAWLGGDGDTWERGPYWIDGLYPLARILGDEALLEKAMPWIEWTLANQREDGYIGPVELPQSERTRPAPNGAQIQKPGDWWPRMVMLKILQQHYLATSDERVIECLLKYFRYQLKTLPEAPLYEPGNPRSGSWWAAQRGGDNLMAVLWLYNVTGKPWLLELANLIHVQTVPVTDWFLEGDWVRHRADQGDALHCVNFAQMMKTPIIRWQQNPDQRHFDAVDKGFADIRAFHGQPTGLYGGDEGLHGHDPGRGSELCSAVEMMFSLEKMLEISGKTFFGDRIERIAFNALPTQATDDFRGRQYFQQTNQVLATFGDRDFFNDDGDRVVFGLLTGYPCCTCNMHQGWPKFTQHLWMATEGRGLAALVYAPSAVTAKVDDGTEITITEKTGYPFQETITFTISTPKPVTFPLHLRIPGWCQEATVRVNQNKSQDPIESGSILVLKQTWKDGDTITLRLPMTLRTSTWYNRAKTIERGPLVFALDIEERWSEVERPRPQGVPESAMHRGYIECTPQTPWNYAFLESAVNDPAKNFEIEVADRIPLNPWTRETAPVHLSGNGVRLPYWDLERNSAANPPLSPAPAPSDMQPERIRLIPYGSTTLRIAEFPWLRDPR